ncbi:MAG TPA: aldo/keto reductase [Leeuwenhoekiella sp.]|nr:aldo/keto reductase [Leeuwenhoekiella sp.]
MKYRKLGNTNIDVSVICLGTMTFGEQNNQEDGFEQLDYALERGVNFIDTAELYSVPSRAETHGSTERIIGSWLKNRGKRDDLIIASKIVGPAAMSKHIRTGGYTKAEFKDAIHKSLKRLQTDYLDLYQLHWPERNTNYFGKLGYTHDPDEEWKDNFAEVLGYLQDFVSEGLIRHVGVSNETAYGLSRYIEESRKGLPKMITVQNPYNLLNRKDEIGLTEVMQREEVGYLAYSPLGFGTLSGKYIEQKDTEASRINKFPQYSRYSNEQAVKATKRYLDLAKKYDLSLTQMALAFVTDRPFMTANIIGATNLEQLKENIDSVNIQLSPELLEEIETIHNAVPNPAP